MSSSFQALRDLKKKKNFKKNRKDILFMRDFNLPLIINKKYSKNREKTYNSTNLYRCVLTGRNRGVLTEYKLARMAFKSLSESGLIPGVHKSSW